MKKLAKITILAAATSFLCSAFADPMPSSERLDWGIYTGLQLGYSSLNAGSSNQSRVISGSTYTFKSKERNIGANVHLGSLWPISDTPFSFGGQIGATYWGRYVFSGTGATVNDATYNQISFNLEGVVQYTLNRTFYLRLGLGPAVNFTEESGGLRNATSSVTATKNKKIDAIGSVTVGWFISQPTSLYLNVQKLFAQNSKSSSSLEQGLLKSTQFSIGVAYDLGP